MQKILILALGTITVLVLGTIIFQYFMDTSQKDKNSGYTDLEDLGTVERPESEDPYTTLIPTDAGVIEIFDIRTLPEVTKPGEGFYHLRGEVGDPDAPFSLLYSEIDNSFSIAIENEPIALNHELASRYFSQLLQISDVDACKLNVYIGVPYSVNPDYQGRRFDLTFCKQP